MFRLPISPRDRPSKPPLTWRSVVVSYALTAGIPLLLWVVMNPLAGSVMLAAVASLYVGGRRAARLIRCFYDCKGFTFDLLGRARITVTQVPTNDVN